MVKNNLYEQHENKESLTKELLWMLKNDSRFCAHFFSGTLPVFQRHFDEVCDFMKVRQEIISFIWKHYEYRLSPEDCSHYVFSAIWSEGSFKPLNTFSHKSSFENWLFKVGRNAVVKRLAEENLIPKVGRRTVGNSRLTMLSQPIGVCETVIDDLIISSKHHRLLTALYVDRLNPAQIMEKQGISAEEFDLARKLAERELKMALLQLGHPYQHHVLKAKSAADWAITISCDFLIDMAATAQESVWVNILKDVIGINLEEADFRVKIIVFLDDFAAKLHWSEQDRYIWHSRFIEDKPPVLLALELGRSRAWLDNRYSRLNKAFQKAIKQWWRNQAA